MLKVGHRGAPRVAPANTMASFRSAIELGCDWVECDCRPSADGIVVLSHDPCVTDVSGTVYQVNAYPAEVLAGLDLGVGEGVPTLEQLVEYAAGRCGVMADVKAGGIEREIGAALAPLGRDSVPVPGADRESRACLRRLYPSLPLSRSLGVEDEAILLSEWESLDTDAVTLHYSLVTPDRIAALHDRGIRTFAWTVDQLASLRRLAGWGVDGLISNRADLLALL